ncbi:MAG TPA: NlpC/P60 family protein [Bacilli bacterium]
MRPILHKTLIWVLVSVLFIIPACTTEKKQAPNDRQPSKMKQFNTGNSQPELLTSTENASIPLITQNGEKYVAVREIVNLLDYHGEWDPASLTYKIGDTDVVYQLRINSRQAIKEETPIQLAAAPMIIHGTAYIPVSSINDLFQEDMTYRIEDQALTIYPPQGQSPNQDAEEDFGDDPGDPAKAEEASVVPNVGPTYTAARLRNVNTNKLIRTSRRYLGVRYKFGAAPYPRSKRFDCSTYSKFVYAKYGVRLGGTARSQARQGNTVSKKRLRKGDLMFFYVPGRFKSNRVVGHIGIYMGGGRMIHSSPEPKNGVQITNINKAYWKKTFLKAKRVVY